jgi:hypothetical protein
VSATAAVDVRTEANERFFAAEADRIACLCRELAERFTRGGRLLAVGGSPQAWSDARHVAVEFVHPVIVGKRALPALALAPEQVPLLAAGDDVVMSFEPLTIDGETFEPPTDDPSCARSWARRSTTSSGSSCTCSSSTGARRPAAPALRRSSTRSSTARGATRRA